MEDKVLFDMTLSELEHSGVKGMKWGKRKASYMSAVDKHETKTKDRRAHNNDKIQTKKDNEKALSKKLGTKYMDAANKHEAKTQARTDKRKASLKNAGTKYMDAANKHEAKTQARTERRKASLKNAGKKYMDASKKHEAKTVAKDIRRKERVKKAYNSTIKTLNNPTLKKSVDTLIIANASYVVTTAAINQFK